MKTIAQILGTMTLALVTIAVCVFAAGDRQTLVPPPDAVGEAFLRQVTARRYDRALALVSGRQGWSAESLRRYLDPLWRLTGAVNHVDAELVSIDGDDARVAATGYGDVTEVRVVFALFRENGLWKVHGFSTNPPLPPEPLE